MSLVGKEVLPFKADAYQNGEFLQVTHEDLKDQWSVVVFYPADFTFVCPTELEDLQSEYANLRELGVEVYSVSTDTHYTHKAWHDNSPTISNIEFVMVGDPSHTLSKNFNVLIEEEGLADRATFIIDPDGVVQGVEINAGNLGRDASAIVSKIKAAQYVRNNPEEVCPAKWKEGSKTLKPGLDLVGKI
jgi:peroxiredoxin (alkyl hydroperoxide reductase subunit C)